MTDAAREDSREEQPSELLLKLNFRYSTESRAFEAKRTA